MVNSKPVNGNPYQYHNYFSRNGWPTIDINGLLPLLNWLDQRLANDTAVLDPDSDVMPSIEMRADSALAWLQQRFSLSGFDVMVIAIALAPELDRRYEHVYAYLQEDARRQRPTVDLVLTLLCGSAAEKLEQRANFATDAPLIKQELVHLISDESSPLRTTLLAQEIQLDEQVVNLLLDQPGLDRQLHSFCRLHSSQSYMETLFPILETNDQALLALIRQHWEVEQFLRLYFQGVDRVGKQRTAEAIAATLKVPLLSVDLAQLIDEKVAIKATLRRIIREAQFQGALLYLDDLDSLLQEHRSADRTLAEIIAEHPGIVILSGTQSYAPLAMTTLGLLPVEFTLPSSIKRQKIWQKHLQKHNILIDKLSVRTLSDRFQLTADQIGDAVATASKIAELQAFNQSTTYPQPTMMDLFAAARSQAGKDLVTLTRKLPCRMGWGDIVLPPQSLAVLQELCQEAQYQSLVWETWGFAEKLSSGKGLSALFSGPPGTGKTLAASVIAHELRLDLYQIDLSQMVSKYIGETEKNLNRVFTAAANSNAILLFDEADALFGKRSEVRDAHDRYANIETSYLLQKMEEYEGIAILTTNFRSNLDEAFVRRLRFIVEFALPGPVERRRIWEQIWPEQTPRRADLDLEWLANQFELPGANIRNIALRAAFLAAGEGEVVEMQHLVMALQREYQKLGKILMGEHLGVYARLLCNP